MKFIINIYSIYLIEENTAEEQEINLVCILQKYDNISHEHRTNKEKGRILL